MSKTLLIVDDEEKILSRMEVILEGIPDTILTASNGQEALQVYKNNEIDCIISDINMPIMNGIDLIKNIRKIDKDIPFIFYTAHGNHNLMLEVAKYGAFDFIEKPALDSVEEIVKRALAFKTDEDLDTITEFKKILDDDELKNES